ncbi:MAG: ribbon-helix-helix domain-containing protein [Sulfolobales archaeon]
MVKEISVKLSEDVYEKIEKLAEKTGKSKADIIREALLLYLGSEVGEKAVESSKSYIKPAIYSGKCSRCGREIQQGELAGFIKIVYTDKSSRTFAYCLDCYNSLSDKTILSLELKKHRLKRVVTALQRQMSKMLSIYDELEKASELYTKIKTYVSELNRYLEQVYHGDNKSIEKLVFELADLNNQLSEFVKLLKFKREAYVKRITSYTNTR